MMMPYTYLVHNLVLHNGILKSYGTNDEHDKMMSRERPLLLAQRSSSHCAPKLFAFLIFDSSEIMFTLFSKVGFLLILQNDHLHF